MTKVELGLYHAKTKLYTKFQVNIWKDDREKFGKPSGLTDDEETWSPPPPKYCIESVTVAKRKEIVWIPLWETVLPNPDPYTNGYKPATHFIILSFFAWNLYVNHMIFGFWQIQNSFYSSVIPVHDERNWQSIQTLQFYFFPLHIENPFANYMYCNTVIIFELPNWATTS